MTDSAALFRARLADELRDALSARDRDRVATVRSVMAAIDNAGAVPAPAEPMHEPGSDTEVQRRALGDADIRSILELEIAERSAAASEYERYGEAARAMKLRASIATIRRWLALWDTGAGQ